MNGLFQQILLPGLTIPGNLLLAPLAGYTDAAFRWVCLDHGASFCFTEMISAEGLARGNDKTYELLGRSQEERLWGAQVFGADPASAAAAVHALEPLGVGLYDLNCGCSVPKVLKTGAGASLLRDPKRIQRLVAAMKSETQAPVAVKLRSGWSHDSLSYLAAAEAAVAGGASLVSLHPRTRAQGFTGSADWDQITALKRALPVPVLGSGDLFCAEDARRMLQRTGCDGVLFARGALGNPFVFAQTRALLRGETPAEPIQAAVRLQTALEHLRKTLYFKSEAVACREMRKHFCFYTRGVPGAAELRQRIVRAERFSQYAEIVKDYLDRSDAMDREEGPAAGRPPIDDHSC